MNSSRVWVRIVSPVAAGVASWAKAAGKEGKAEGDFDLGGYAWSPQGDAILFPDGGDLYLYSLATRNLRAAIDGAWLKAYRPQRHYLVLIGTGDEHAVAVRGKLSAEGGWAWRWKQAIDRRFLGSYNEE